MAQAVGICQQLAVTTFVWCLFFIPSFCISPINNVLKYLACVVIYPKVRLTWSGVMGCFSEIRVLLEGRIYLNVILFYVMVWWLLVGCRRLVRALRPPQGINAFWNSKAVWEYTKQCTTYLPYHGGYYTWMDLQWFWNNQLSREYWSYRRSDILQRHFRVFLKWASKIVDVILIWSSTRFIKQLQTKTQALVWKITSYNVHLHIRFWSYVAECVCHMAIANPERYLIGTHRDVLQKHVFKFLLYRSLPLRNISRLWGQFNNTNLPVWLRPHAYTLYIRMFGCKLEEATITDLKYYQNLGEFFRRSLKPNLRPVDLAHDVTSPVDGEVVYSGQISEGKLEQIKGVTYSLTGFMGKDTELGQTTWTKHSKDAKPKVPSSVDDTCYDTPLEYFSASVNFNLDFSCGHVSENDPNGDCHVEITKSVNIVEPRDADAIETSTAHSIPDNIYHAEAEFARKLITANQNMLYQCIIYLAPGDYHRFHSPVDWTVNYRRHFPGNLFSVKPGISRWLQGVLVLNERVVYTGRWKHGFFSMTAVGATNVGSINVFFDKGLETNTKNDTQGSPNEAHFNRGHKKGIPLRKGELFGEFNLGSTIVMIFEAPAHFQLRVSAGDRVKYGQGLVLNPSTKQKKKGNFAGCKRR